MNAKSPFLVLKKDCGEAIHWISGHLNRSGLQVLQTFDLQAARAAHGSCSCPHHGDDQCDCQMAVLLVYGNGHPPASLVAHGRDGQTWFVLADSYPQGVDTALGDAIQKALAPHFLL